MKELINIQSELKAPKTQFNRFGNYNYRKAEDILEAVKPLLKREVCTLTITDEIVQVGNRIYVKATATLKNSQGEVEVTTGFAREDEMQKGMNGSQLTGSASSFARKYALNGLFAIDDNQDSDTTNVGNQASGSAAAAAPQQQKTAAQLLAEAKELLANVKTKDELTWVYNTYAVIQGNKDFLAMLTAKRKELRI